jgi:hypothetical protein
VKLAPVFLILGLIISGSGIAQAKSRKAHAFSFFDDGGKHNQAECDPEKKAPRKMKRKKEFAKFGGYLGSELVESAQESPTGVEAWKHYFASSGACSESLRQHPTKTP